MQISVKYNTIRAFEKHLEGAAPNHFSQTYLILGKEAFDCKEALEVLLRRLFPTHRSQAVSFFEGGSVVAEDILSELNSVSFLAERRGFIIQQADKLKKNVQEALDAYIARPQRSHFLILIAPSLLKTSTFYKKIEKEGIVLDLPECKPWEKEKHLVEWAGKQVTSAHKSISYQACQCLVKSTGTDPSILMQELDKLICFIGDRKEITVQDIYAVCTALDTETIWRLGEAIFRFESRSAVSICNKLLLDSNALLPLLRQIRSQFQTGYQISTILDGGGGMAEVAQEFSYMKGQILERNISLARQYGSDRYKQGLLAIDDAEMQCKNSQIEDSLLAELLIFKLSTRR